MDVGSEAYLSHKVLDAEHQGQIDLLLQVEKEFSGAASPARLAFLLDRLIEFTDIHFMSEQVLMRERAYPGLPAHEEEHSQLIEHMRSFQRCVEAEGLRLTADHVSGLRSWVLHHIQTKDAAFARYLGRDTNETLNTLRARRATRNIVSHESPCGQATRQFSAPTITGRKKIQK